MSHCRPTGGSGCAEMPPGTDNNEQQDFWSGPSGQSWITHEDRQDALLASVAQLVITRAELGGGARVLDIGCGTGAVAELAAGAVGFEGSVLATDISEPLLKRASVRLGHLPQVATLRADAATARWPDPPFDVAVSRFGVMFFSEPPNAFRNIANALKPGGRFVFATWGPVSENPYWSLGAEVAGAHLGQVPPPPAHAPGPMGLADRDYARNVVKQAGLVEVSVTQTAVSLEYSHDAHDLANLMVAVGSARRILNAFEADETQVRAIRDEIAERLLDFEQSGQVSLPASINLIEAMRP